MTAPGRANMRLLFINPNTSAHLTELGARVARSVARPETEIVPATGRFGARYITSRAAAGVAGLAGRIGDEVPVPVIDNVVASVRVAEAAAMLGAAKAKSGSFAAATPVKTTGLSPALAALLEGREA